MNKEPSRTLVIDKPFGQVLLLAILFALAAWILLNCALQAALSVGLIQPPRIGSANAELDAKLLLLDRYVKENGPIDCIFLGSSQFDQAVDPAVFASAFDELGGRLPRCFNFSLGTMTVQGDGAVARMLASRYHPSLLYVGISARDFSDDFGELTRPLLDDPWLRYSLGDRTFGGWLTEYSIGYRALLTLRSELNHDYMVFHDRLSTQLTETGYQRVKGNDLSNPKKNFIPNFKMSREDMAGLDQVIALNSVDMQVIFVEVPVHPSFIPYYIQADPAAYDELFVRPISAYISGSGLPFWQTQQETAALIPDGGWNDVKHLNETGAVIFSRALAEKTRQALQNGEIVFPSMEE